jgi:hypothetical protein
MYQKTLLFLNGIRHSICLIIFAFAINSSFGQNAIYQENTNLGTPSSTWDIPDNGNGTHGDLSIQGFATDISVNKGGTINFKITVTSGTDKIFGIQIYRLGFYQGNGARLIANLGNAFTGITQNACNVDATGLTDCGNWTTTTSWTVPSTATSGYYIAKLTRSVTGGGGSSHIAFIVRDDVSTSNLFFKASDATWQAYNGYGGNSLYAGPGLPFNHGKKVSYNRPFVTRNVGGGGGAEQDWLFNSEYPMIRFLEANGYDISYTTDLDISRNNANNINLLLNHKVFLSVGHDEYWSKEERNSVEAAKAAGVHMAFFSGNEIYWKTRWENSIDGTGTPFRTLVCYKEGTLATPAENPCGGKCDPDPEWTGLWRDGCSFPGGNACKPENALSGQISWDGNSLAMQVPDTYKNLRFWRNTPVAALASGATATLTLRSLGYEWDWEQFQSSYPPGRVTMSSTTLNGHTHKLSLYKAPSGAIIFGAGTVQWAWGLDAVHDAGNDPADRSMQQSTINLFADMGVQPDPAATLITGLTRAVGSTDNTPPSSAITSPANGANIPQDVAFTITGTATDIGGIVAGVEVSVDGGVTWQAATGTNSWSYSWTPLLPGPVIIKSRAFDDIGNLENLGGSEGSSNTVNVTVVSGPPPTNCPCTIFTLAQGPVAPDNDGNDGNDITLGVKFQAAYDGTIAGIRFFAGASDNSSDHSVQLFRLDGTSIATATQPIGQSTIPNGWNEILFSSPIPITANTVYVATYYSPGGNYTLTDNSFLTPLIRGPLTVIADDVIGNGNQGPNGVFDYGTAFPISGFQATNYWVDVDYSNGVDQSPPTVLLTSPVNGATNINVNSFISATFSENIDPTTVNGTTLILKDASNAIIPATVNYTSSSKTATIIPSSALDYTATYTATVKGGPSGIKDLAGNSLAVDYVWSFSTATAPAVPPDDGAGGPLLVISSTLNPFSRYMVEILRAQGYTAFKAVDISEVRSNPSMLDTYDVILLGNMTVNGSDVTLLTNWTTAGGTLIAQRPSTLLLPLMGVTANGSTADKYLRVNSTAGQPGVGIVGSSIQYHGSADQYTILTGTTALATIYTPANTNTIFPAITTHSVGANGGKAIAFAYDLAKSIVTTRQGNPALVGQNLDGQSGPIRSDNLFFNSWLDFNNVQIPQADEQQHLLTNIILQSNLHRKPLPHLWFLPSGFKAAVVMTGDDHNINRGSTEIRFNEYLTQGPNTAQDVADWKAVRGTSYMVTGINIPDDSVAYYQQQGFELALHPTTNCINFTPASLNSAITTQLSSLQSQLPSLISPVSNRTHCLPWSDWSTQPTVENSLGIRFDVNYYYWPGTWVADRPGMFTGSGMPMRFSDLDGGIIDCYQAPTQITDESDQDIPVHINKLLDNAVNLGYYGVFAMNMHTDLGIHPGSDAIVASAQSHGVPVVSAKQMLTWLDSRNNTTFSNMTWLNSRLSFTLTSTAHNLQAMVPVNSADGSLIQVTVNGNDQPFAIQTIKGILYGVFSASTNNYVAIYSSTALPITLTDFTVTKQNDNALLNWSTSQETNNKGFEIQRSTDASSWTVIGFVAGAGNSETEKDYQWLDQNLPAGRYYYRLRQVDYDGRSSFSKIGQVTIDGGLALELKQNRPNPFNNSTTIDIVIPKAGKVLLVLYDQMGRPIQRLLDEFKTAGTYSIPVDRNGLSSGIYYYKMDALGQSLIRKMTIL